MSLKNIFIKNPITYNMYIYYNLYIRNKAYKKRDFYSQWGEDLFIKDFFKDKQKGFYVDIGCFHPIMYNNTCLLFNKGWSGINIDLNQTSIDLFNIIRPSDYNVCAAVSYESSEKKLFFDHPFSPVNTIQESFYKNSDKKNSFKYTKDKVVKTKTFKQIIENYKNIPEVDFLNIDCEGHDYSVLRGIDLQIFKPKLICIETHKVDNSETEINKNIINFLIKYNYNIVKRCGPSSIFSKSE